MADVKWIKLSVNMFEDEKIRLIETLPEADTILIIWVKLLAQAGKTNATGYIFLSERFPYTEEMLATIFNRPINVVRLALKTFEQFGMIEISDDHFISITNWEKHQNLDGLEKIKEQTRKRVAKHRETKQKQDVTLPVTQGNATEVDKELDLDIDKEKELEEVDKGLSSPHPSNPSNCFDFYGNNFGLITQHISQKILAWLNDFNGQDEIIMKAMEIALERNKRSWGYAEGILKDWYSHNARTMQEIEAYEIEKKNHRTKQNVYPKQATRKEMLPDWFDEREPYKQEPKKELSPEELEEHKAEIKKMLEEFRNKK